MFIFATFGIFGREKRKLACRKVSAKSDFHAKHHVVVCPGYCPLLPKYNKGPVRGLVIAFIIWPFGTRKNFWLSLFPNVRAFRHLFSVELIHVQVLSYIWTRRWSWASIPNQASAVTFWGDFFFFAFMSNKLNILLTSEGECNQIDQYSYLLRDIKIPLYWSRISYTKHLAYYSTWTVIKEIYRRVDSLKRLERDTVTASQTEFSRKGAKRAFRSTFVIWARYVWKELNSGSRELFIKKYLKISLCTL